MLSELIVKTAEEYLGQTEKAGNRGWEDPDFEAKMKAVGWKPTHSWCCYFAELVWKEALDMRRPRNYDKLMELYDKFFSASCTATYANFRGSSYFTTGNIPKAGALAVWRYGNGWTGHIGICTKGADRLGRFPTIEGNTNAAGEREGMFVMRKDRRTGLPFRAKGLNLIGFIYPPNV
jgi:hypothetical protein